MPEKTCDYCGREWPAIRSCAQHRIVCKKRHEAPQPVTQIVPDTLTLTTVQPLPEILADNFHVVKTDGGAPNNGVTHRSSRSSAGAVLLAPYAHDDDKKMSVALLLRHAQSSNEAKYQSFLNVLCTILRWKLPKVKLLIDSKFVIAQVLGHARCNFTHLQRMLSKLVEKIRRFGTQLKISHVTRDKNREADAAANKSLKDLRSSLFCICSQLSVACSLPLCTRTC